MAQPQKQQGDIMDAQRVALVDAKARLYLELQQTPKGKYTEADVEIREQLLKDPDLQKRVNHEQ